MMIHERIMKKVMVGKIMNTMMQIAAAWKQVKTPVVFTGAGMSTESGFPDFRSAKQGLWKTRPESLATMTALETQPNDFYFFYQWRIAKLWDVTPNPGHVVLAALEKRGHVHHIITQNVDGLHQRAGSKKVIELHGSLRTVRCVKCSAQLDSRQLLPSGDTWETDYAAGKYQAGTECVCPKCGGFLRPEVVLFGESLPSAAWEEAAEFSRTADFFVVLGSSLAVSPANLCPQVAVNQGAKLLIVNQEPTPLDDKATWVIRDSIGRFLCEIEKQIGG